MNPEKLVEGDWWKKGCEPMPKSDAFIRGFAEAERQFYVNCDVQGPEQDALGYVNPFAEGTDQWEGFGEGVYTFTQK